MNFESDLAHNIKRQFDEHNIVYKAALDVRSLTARYLEMLNRRIVPIPRKVHFSEEIHDSLGALRRKADMEQRKAAADAWGAVFLIRHLLVEGKNVNCFLSTRIDHAAGRMSKDGLLWISACTTFISIGNLIRRKTLGKEDFSIDRMIFCLRL